MRVENLAYMRYLGTGIYYIPLQLALASFLSQSVYLRRLRIPAVLTREKNIYLPGMYLLCRRCCSSAGGGAVLLQLVVSVVRGRFN